MPKNEVVGHAVKKNALQLAQRYANRPRGLYGCVCPASVLVQPLLGHQRHLHLHEFGFRVNRSLLLV